MNKLTSIFSSISTSSKNDDQNDSDDEFVVEYQSKIDFLKTLQELATTQVSNNKRIIWFNLSFICTTN